MFSSRMKWNLEPNQLSRLIEEKKRLGVKLLDLTESNPTRSGFDYPSEEILQALTAPQSIYYEPHPQGLSTAREAISQYYQGQQQNIDPENIFLTASTSEAYSWLFKLLADQGDRILVPQPSYPLFDFLATLEGIELQPYQLDYDHSVGWEINFSALESQITPKTKALIIVNPNNPTGSFLKKEEYLRLQKICLEHRLALIVDEVFRDYYWLADDSRVTDFGDCEALTFILNGFSKTLALPQMKLGWIVVEGPPDLKTLAGRKLEFIADTFLSVNTPIQHATPACLRFREMIQGQIISRCRTNFDGLFQRVGESSCRLLKLEGGWSATIEIPRIRPEEEFVLELLADENILVHPGYFFDFHREGILVLSLLPQPEKFRLASEKILSRIGK